MEDVIMKTFTDQVVLFSNKLNVVMVIRIIVLLAFLFAALANPGSVLADPAMGGSVG